MKKIISILCILLLPCLIKAQQLDPADFLYDMDVEFRNARFEMGATDKYFVCDLYLRSANMPAENSVFETMFIVFEFNHDCFEPTPGVGTIQFTPTNPKYNEVFMGFSPYNILVDVFINRPNTFAQIGYAVGNGLVVTMQGLTIDRSTPQLWGEMKWKLKSGAAGKTGIKVREHSTELTDDVSTGAAFTASYPSPARLNFINTPMLDIEIPGAKPVVAPPTFAANQDTVICRPPVSSTYTLAELPTASDSCLWYVSASPKGEKLAGVADVTRVGTGGIANVDWKTTTSNNTYYLNVFSMSKGYSSDTISKKINVIGFPPPTITVTPNCDEEVLTYTSESGITGTWYNTDYSASASAAIPYGATEIGIYHLVRESGACKDTVDTDVTQITEKFTLEWAQDGKFAPPATHDIATSPGYLDVAILPMPESDVITWVKPTPSSGVKINKYQVEIDINKLTLASLDFEVYVTRANGCKTNTLTGHTDFVNGGMKVDINKTSPELCQNGSVVLTTTVARGAAPLVWAWYKQGASDTVRSEAYVVNEAGMYGVKVTDSNGKSVIETVEIRNNSTLAPVIKAGPDQLIATGTSTVLTASLTSGAADRWVWGPSGSLSTGGQFSGTKPLTETQRFGVYAVGGGCTSNVDSMLVTVDKTTPPGELLSVVVNPRSSTVCIGNTVDFVVEAVTGDLTGATFEWLPSDGKLSNTNSSTTTYTASVQEIQKEYAVLVTKAGQTVAAKTMVTVGGSNAPILELKEPNLVKCSGDTIIIVNNGTIKPTNYHWFINNDPVVVNQDTSYVLATAGSYDIRVVGTSSTSCTSDTLRLQKTIGTGAQLVGLTTDVTTCETSGTLEFTSITPTDAPFAWLKPDKTLLNSTDKSVPVTVSGDYYMAYGSGTCADTVTIPVRLNNAIEVIGLSDFITSCDMNADLTFTSSSATSFKWLNSDKTAISGSDDQNPWNVTASGIYYLALDGGSCSDTMEVSVELGVPPMLTVDKIQTSCTDSHSLVAGTSGGVVKWFKGNTLLTSTTINKTDGLDYRVIAEDGSCKSDTVDVTVHFGTSPRVNVITPQTACGSSLTLDGSASGGQLVWLGLDKTTELTNLTVATAGTYYAYAKDGSCLSSDTVGVDVRFGAAPILMVDKIQTTCGTTHTLSAETSGGTIKWFRGNTLLTSTTINKTDGLNYRVTAEDGSCNSDTVDVTVHFGTSPRVNVVSPQTACGSSLTLNGSASGGQLVWLALDKTTELTNLTVATAGTYYAYAKDGNCKSADTVDVTVSFGVSPILTVDKIQTTCGTTHTLSAETSGGTIKWFKGNTLLTSTTINKTDGLNYRVTAEDGSCKSDTVDVTVHFGTSPRVNVVSPQTACGSSLTLEGSASGGDLVWLGLDKKTELTNLTVTTAGTYYAYAKDGSCLSSDTVGVDVRFGAAPILTVDKIQTTCGTTHTLSAETSGGTIKWFKGNTLLTSTTISDADGTDYRVTAEDGSCKSDTVDVTVHFGTSPRVNVVSPQTACGSSLTLEGSASGGQLVWLGLDKTTELTNLTVATAGTYYAYAKDGNCKSADTVDVTVSFGVSPILTVDKIQTTCGTTHTLSAQTSGGTIKWFRGNTLLTSTTISDADGTDYRVTAEDGSCKSDTVDVTVHFGTSPRVNVVSPQTACGNSLTLEGSASGGQLVWLDSDKKTELTNLTVTTAGTYYAYAKDGSCKSADTVDVTVSFGVSPILTVDKIQTSCTDSHSLVAGTSGGVVKWFKGNTLLTSTTINKADGTDYRVTVTDGSCNSDTVDVTVHFGTSPRVNVITPQTACGSSLTLDGSASGGQLVWLGLDKTTELTNLTVATAGTYYAYAKDGSCLSSDTVGVDVRFGAAPILMVDKIQTTCGTTHTLSAETSGGTIKWFKGNTPLTSTTISDADGTDYRVTAEDESCKSDTVDVTVHFGTSPRVNVITPQTACGNSLTLEGSASGGQLVWLGSDKKTELTNLTVATAGTYYAYAKDGNCKSADTVDVTVSFGVSPILTVDKIQTTCDTTHTLSAQTSGGTIKWFRGNTLLTSTTINKTDGLNYRVTAEDGSCKSDTVDVTVHFGTSPRVNVITPQTACGSSLTLDGSASGGQLVWLGLDKKTELTNLTVATAGTYYAYAKDGNCKSADTVDVTVSFGVSPILTVDKIQTTCGTTHTLLAETSGGTIKWFKGNTLLTSTTISDADGTDYRVTAEDGSCKSDTVDVTVRFSTSPSVNVITPQTACGNSLTLEGSASGGDLVWLGLDKKTELTNLTVTRAGTYYAYAKDGSCKSVDTVDVTVRFGVSPILTVDKIQTTCGTTHTLSAQTSGGTIKWFKGNTLLTSTTINKTDGSDYRVTAEDGSCNSDTVDVTVNFGTSPRVNVITPQTACGNSLTLDGSASGGQLVWLGLDKKTELTNLTVATEGTYYAYAKDGSCLSSDTVGVDVRFGAAPILMVDKIQTSCDDAHTLSAQTSGGTIKWSDGSGLLGSTTISGVKGTTQVYSVIAIDGSCSSPSETVTVSFGANPSVNVITPQTACGNSLTLKGSASGGQLVWLGLDNTTKLTNLTVTTSGKYYVYAKDGSCESENKIEVDVQLKTDPSINVNTNQLACGNTHVLTATASGGSVHWISGGSELFDLVVTGNEGDVKTFEVFAKDGTCESSKKMVTVTFGTPPVIVLSDVNCLGDTLWAESQVGTIDTYRWTIDGEVKQHDAKDYYVFAATGNYTVSCVGFVGTCESAPAVATVRINSTPTIAWNGQPQADVSAGTMLNGCVQAAGGSEPYTYVWSVAGVSGDCFSIQAVQPSYDFQAYVVDVNGCMSDTTTTAHVTVTGFGSLTVTAEAVYGTEICTNGSVILSADVVGGTAPYTYEWYEKGASDKLIKSFVGNSLNDVLTMLTPTAGTYVVKVKDSAMPLAMGEAEIVLTTTMKTAPVANAGVDLTVKTGEKAVLLGSATPQSGNTQWHWTPADQLNDVAEASKQYPLTAKINSKKEFALYVIDADGCVSQPDTMVVDVSATGVKLQVLPETGTLCQGNTQLLRVVTTPKVADSEITWSPAAGLTEVNNDSTVFTPTASGSYTFIATVVSGGKTYTGKSEVTVNSGSAPMFDLVTSTGDVTLCQQDTVKVKYAAGAERATSYVWSIGGSSVGVDSFYVVNTVGTHEIKVSASSGSCAATEKSISVTVNQGPVIASLTLVDSCGSAVVEVAGTGVTNYAWSATPSGAVDVTNSNRYVITGSGNFTVEVSATNGNCSMKKQLTGVIHDRPSLVWGVAPSTSAYEPGDNVNVTVVASGGSSPYSYHWLQPTGITETSGGYNLQNVSLANYTFEVYAVDKNGCASSDTLKEGITVLGGNIGVTLASDYGDAVCKDGYARLTAKVEGVTVPCVFSWYKGTDLATAIQINSVNDLYDVLWVAAADVDKYTVKVKDKNNNTGDAEITTLSVDNTKTAPVVSAGPDMTIPTGKQTVLLGEVTTAGTLVYQWHWSPADKLSVLADTASQFPWTGMLTAPQSYSVYVVDDNNCVSGPDTASVDVNDATGLCLTAMPVNEEVCRNNSVTFESQVTCGTVSNSAVYSWLPNTELDRADTSVVKFGPATNGVYEYAVSVTENGVTAAARVKVTVKDLDAPKLDISGRWDCVNDTLVVKNNGFTEKEYVWTVDGIVVSEKSHIFALNVKNIKRVMVYATAENGCSSDTVSRTMNLGVIPPVNITEGSFAEYKDSVFVLNVDNDPLLTATDYTFAWSSEPDNKINGDKDQLAMTSVALSEDVRYIFTATDKNNAVCQGIDTVTAYLIPDAPKLDIDKNADNNIVLSWDPLVNADSARIMFNEWDGYGVASAYKQRHINKAEVTEYTVDVSNDTLEFFYVNASRYIDELGQSFHSHASDTMGYFRQWIFGYDNGSDTRYNWIGVPFDMSSKGIDSLYNLGDMLGKAIVKIEWYDNAGLLNISRAKSYTPETKGWSGGTAKRQFSPIIHGGSYRVTLDSKEESTYDLIQYGKLPSSFSYDLLGNGASMILNPLSFGKNTALGIIGDALPFESLSATTNKYSRVGFFEYGNCPSQALQKFRIISRGTNIITGKWTASYGKDEVMYLWRPLNVFSVKDINWKK